MPRTNIFSYASTLVLWYASIFFVGLLISSCAKTHLTEAQRLELDQKAVVSLQRALVQLANDEQAKAEADLVAKALVQQTYQTNREFNMTGGPKWHNFLIKLGMRKKGYCYHWVPELLKALPPQPLKYFERHWGGSFLSMGRENNAVIITKRGSPVETGLVYDAWRGVGRPFWIFAAQDKKYRWTQRFSESEILRGEAKVEPK